MIELRQEANMIGNEIKYFTTSENVYNFHNEQENIEILCDDENIEIYAECALRILDVLEKFYIEDELSNVKVNLFIKNAMIKHNVEYEDDLFWPTMESFSNNGIFKNSKELKDIMFIIAETVGCKPMSAEYMLLIAPEIMKLILCTAIDIDHLSRNYHELAISMTKVIMSQMEKFRRDKEREEEI